MRLQVAVLLLCLVGAPSHALTLSTSGPDMTPCGDQICVDVSWGWGGLGELTTESSGQIVFTLPMPDPVTWGLSSGRLVISPGGAAYVGVFDALEAAQLVDSSGVLQPAGALQAEYFVLGATGNLLVRTGTSLGAQCNINGEPTVRCVDGNPTGSRTYDVVPGDNPSFLGPLTVGYDFSNRMFRIVPLSETYGVDFSGNVHLIYDRVIPEPSTGLLVMTGLLGIAYQQRRYGRAG